MVVPGAKDNVRNFKEHFNRGNVEESLQIVKDLLTANDVGYDDGWIIHNIIYILKKVIHVLIEKKRYFQCMRVKWALGLSFSRLSMPLTT